MKPVPELAVGETWAYRARGQDPLVQVSIVRLGIKTPARVLVRWVADEFEGAQDWVPRRDRPDLRLRRGPGSG